MVAASWSSEAGRQLAEAGERPHIDAVELKGAPRHRDIALEIGLLDPQFVGLDPQPFDHRLQQVEHHRRAEDDRRRRHRQPQAALAHVGKADCRRRNRQRHQQPQTRLPQNVVNVAQAEDDAVGVQQSVRSG